MAEKYCSHLIQKGHTAQYDHYTCDITSKVCVASTFEDHDYGHPASFEVAEYHSYLADLCPGLDVPDGLVYKVKEHWKYISD